MKKLRENQILVSNQDYSIAITGYKIWVYKIIFFIFVLCIVVLGYSAKTNNKFWDWFPYTLFFASLYLLMDFNFLKAYFFSSKAWRFDSIELELYTDIEEDDITDVYIDGSEISLRFKGIVSNQEKKMKKFRKRNWQKLSFTIGEQYSITVADNTMNFLFHLKSDNNAFSFIPDKIEIFQIVGNKSSD